MKRLYRAFFFLFLFFSFVDVLQAQLFKEQFVDTLDRHIDISRWLATAYGFMPVLMPITEPAVGAGAAGVLVFVHRDQTQLGKKIYSPSSLSGAGGMYTSNNTWGVFGGHIGYWKHDHIRYRGGAAYMSVNLTYYRDAVEDVDERQRDFNLTGAGLAQELSLRLGESRVFIGLRYAFFKGRLTFRNSLNLPEVKPWETDTRLGSLAPLIQFDNRDNTLTPNRGMRIIASYSLFNPALGGNTTFERFDAMFMGYLFFKNRYNIGLRLQTQQVFGDAPFYALPFVQLRGVPVMRYQGVSVYLAEMEGRWDFSLRWSLVGFAGVAKTVPRFENISHAETPYNAGLGLRYLIARLLGIRMGFDIARGPEEWAFYIQFGSAWSFY